MNGTGRIRMQMLKEQQHKETYSRAINSKIIEGDEIHRCQPNARDGKAGSN